MPVCRRCGESNPDAARFCFACGTELAPERTETRRERKVVTVLFADLVGFTGRAEALDPEDVGALLGAYHARVRHELERHGGTVEKFIGDAVMALFGAPVAHEDDPERAVRAALAIRDAVAELNEGGGRELRVRTGITTGETLVKLDARPSEGEGMAAGDVVNTAARLQAAAPESGILIDETTYRATTGAVDAEPVEPVTAKGKSDPVPAWSVRGARARFGVDVFHDARTPLVGRARELDVLQQALARARAEHAPQLVTLIGVPGIGKSRLLWELFRSVDADPELITWRQGRCLPYGEAVAFWALGEMVKAEAGVLETDDATAAEAKLAATVARLVREDEREWVTGHARPLVGLQGVPSSGPSEAFAAWRRLFEGLAELHPLVLVFEDLHWADDGLLDFVDHLVDWAVGVPLLVVCSARPELIERRPAWGGGKLNSTTLALAPLPEDDTARLVAALLDQPLLPAELQHVLLDRAAGNPLYAEQHVRMLADRGFLVRGETGWALANADELPLPETLQGIIAARLDGLAPAEKRLLQDSAVIGKVFWRGALAAVGSGDGDLDEQLHALERKGFVRRDRRSSVGDEVEYAFAHALVRDVAYGQIPRLERGQKHRAAAEWITSLAVERSADRAQLAAHHWLQALELTRAAGREDAELAARARASLVDAGDRASALGASDAARGLYRQAVDLAPPDDPERPDLLRRYATTAARIGIDVLDELAEAADALLAAGDVEGAADCLLARSWFLWNVGDTRASNEVIEHALELLADRPPSPAQAQGYGELAIHKMLEHDLDGAIVLAERELELADSTGVEWHRPHALITIGSARAIADDVEGLAEIERGLEQARELNAVPVVIRGYKNLQSLTAHHADLHAADAVAAEGMQACLRFGESFHVAWFEAERALFAYHQGDWDRALELLDSFFARIGERKHYMEGPARLIRGRIQAERGDVDEGLRESSAALEFARRTGEPQQVMPALAWHALLLVRADRPADASALADEFLEHREITFAVVDLAIVLVALGREQDFERVEPAMRASKWGTAAEALARHEFARAVELFAPMGARNYEAESRLLLARQLAAQGRAEDAAREASLAASFFAAAGAVQRRAETEAARRASA
jgi:class 3 adenylate cyclase